MVINHMEGLSGPKAKAILQEELPRKEVIL